MEWKNEVENTALVSPEKVNAQLTIIEIEIIGQVRGVRDPKSSSYNSSFFVALCTYCIESEPSS